MTKNSNTIYETVIGLEVHLQLDTLTKIFCGCANIFGQEPNSQTCPVCLGLPGTLPVLNKKSLEYAIKVGLALNCEINPYIKFDRKNYYYPDLPKGYQISQYDLPVARNGYINIILENGKSKKIKINRAHMEEDAGKLIHDNESGCSLVDYNRTGTPLLEIVTDPDLRSPEEAYNYLQILKLTLQYLNVSDCDMEKGSLRCDANISLREKGDPNLGTKTELKNMNSFKAVKTALEFEENRHKKMLSSGGKIIQETRLWDENKGLSFSMRTKEEAHDYRYFPEPDLVPFIVKDDEIKKIQESIPELPAIKFDRLIKEYNISEYDAQILIQDNYISDFFEECTKLYNDTKKICNWINGAMLQEINSRKVSFDSLKINPKALTDIIKNVDNETLSNLTAKDVLKFVIETGKSVEKIIKEKGLAQVSNDSVLEKMVQDIIKENEKIADQIRNGKESAIGFLVGQAMKKSEGKANPKKIGELIKKSLLK